MKNLLHYFKRLEYSDYRGLPKIIKNGLGNLKDENNNNIKKEFKDLSEVMYNLIFKVTNSRKQKELRIIEDIIKYLMIMRTFI